MPTDDPPPVRTRAMIPVATITLAMLAYGDVDAVTGEGEAVRRRREQSKLPRYLRSERLHLDQTGARPKDCFRCHGERANCPMHTGNWRACPHAM